ncbi:MAG: response regulator [Cyanobacteria bacterium J06621_12]
MNHNASLAYSSSINSVLARDKLDKKHHNRLKNKRRSQLPNRHQPNQLTNLKSQTDIKPLLDLSLAETVSILTEIIDFESDILEQNDYLYLSNHELSKKPKILVIEDRDDSLDCICLMLETENFQVIKAKDSATAIQLARTEIPDLIICELMMPKINGYGIVDSLCHSTITANILLLFITAHHQRTKISSEIFLISDRQAIESLTKEKLLKAISRHIKTMAVYG